MINEPHRPTSLERSARPWARAQRLSCRPAILTRDEPASCRNITYCSTWCRCRNAHGLGRVAHDQCAHRTREYQHHTATGQMSRAQSSRKCWAVHAGQLVLQPRPRILR